MKGQKFKTVVVHIFDVPEYRSKYVFVDRNAIRLAIKDGQEAKQLARIYHNRAQELARRIDDLGTKINQTSSSYLQDYYCAQRKNDLKYWHSIVDARDEAERDAVDHGHRANALENPPRPNSTHDEWVRAHDVARLSRRPYRRPARTNQRVAAFDYEDAAEHDVVDRSQLRWQRLVLVLAIILRNAQRRADSFIQPGFTGLGRTVRRCSGCLTVRPISEFPSIRTMWCNRCIEHDILLLS